MGHLRAVACGRSSGLRKGERATTVVLWKELTGAQEGEPDQDRDEQQPRVVARAFSVFNSAQVSGFEPPPAPVLPESERLAQAEAFIAHLGIPTTFGGSHACYQPATATDTVLLPPFAQFRDAASFYATWLHECGHATGAKHRLNRDLTGRFGSAAYAFEEIVVEILSGFVLADLGIAHQPRPDHAAYIASWLKILKEDPRAIFVAASQAQQAADWMHAQQPQSHVPGSPDRPSRGE